MVPYTINRVLETILFFDFKNYKNKYTGNESLVIDKGVQYIG